MIKRYIKLFEKRQASSNPQTATHFLAAPNNIFTLFSFLIREINVL